MAVLGLVSGIACSFVYEITTLWRELSVGIAFGLVIGGYLYHLGLAGLVRAPVFAVLTVLAWLATERTAVELFGQLPGSDAFLSLKGLTTGVLAGLMGAFLEVLAAALLFRFARRRDLGLLTVITGGVLGALFTLLDVADTGLVLFPPWQAGIAFCLALALPKATPTAP